MTSTEAFAARLAQTALRVERRLACMLDDNAPSGERFRPPRLAAAMRHAVLGGGKRLRPFLAMASAEACGTEPLSALDAACALELVHCYSLVHDDLPAMDDDGLRRGQPTVHIAFDEATAILAGDALLTLAFEVMAMPDVHHDPAIRSELVLLLARAAGQGGMVGGQMLDLAAEGRFGNGLAQALDTGSIRQLQAMKTGALISASVMAGARIAGATPSQGAALLACGEALGAAFQIADDILDVEASSATLGKATAKDAAKGKATLVQLMGLEAARAERDRLAAHAISALDGFGAAAEMLRGAAHFAAHRSH